MQSRNGCGFQSGRLSGWKKSGVSIDDLDSIEAARLAKLKVEIATGEQKLAILRRENVFADKVREDAIAAFSVMKAEIMASAINLPPILEGLDAARMYLLNIGHCLEFGI